MINILKSSNKKFTLFYDNLLCFMTLNLSVSNKWSCVLPRVCHCDVYNVVLCIPPQHDFFKAAEDTDDENKEDEQPDKVENG